MPGCNKPTRKNQPRIKYCWNAAEKCSFEPGGVVRDGYVSTFSNHQQASYTTSEPESSGIVTTADLIASVSQIWDCATQLAIFHQKTHLKHNHCAYDKEGVIVSLGREETGTKTHSAGRKCFAIDCSATGQLSSVVRPNIEFVKVTEKMSLSLSDCQNRTPSFFSWLLHGEPWKREGLSAVGVLCKLGSMNERMKEIFPTSVGFTEIEGSSDYCTLGGKGGGELAADRTNLVNDLLIRDDEGCTASVQSCDSSASNCTQGGISTRATTSLSSEYFLGAIADSNEDISVADSNEDISVPKVLVSSLCADYQVCHLNIYEKTCEGNQYTNDGDYLLENKKGHPKSFIIDGECKRETQVASCEKPCSPLAKQEHALSGALAGISVSLCLHPVDTVKTTIQACRVDQKSVWGIGKSIVSERGFTGLYRGIASNISTSAPISALYTFTYESVKGFLLPLLPQEYQSLVHCVAGGCASVATSFIFTPSEHIKQQMQVGTSYPNCWNALVGIIQKGGFSSLYAGWAAVLCRNVPHSIIKFYMYENLKKKMATTSQPNTFQTLLCGGLAGCTAALFSTPFDVVKTRLQTQIPGSWGRYKSVFHALQDVGKYEGLKGLYRGLLPRLIMYMTQGGLFFASYEFFKRLFALEASQFRSVRVRQTSTERDL